ncbi:MAG: methyltransferase domain-containing protein [Planctomycetia bacterium]
MTTGMPPSQLNINVGSGRYPMKGFVNLDNSIFLRTLPLYPLLKPFLSSNHKKIFEEYRAAVAGNTYQVHNCIKKLPYAAGSVNHILCSHFLEHVFHDQARAILRDFRHVLRPNTGTIHLIVPDIRSRAERYVHSQDPLAADEFINSTILSSPRRPSLRYRLMEINGSFGLGHRWMYDESTLSKLVEEAGFCILDRNETPSRSWRDQRQPGEVELVARVK